MPAARHTAQCQLSGASCDADSSVVPAQCQLSASCDAGSSVVPAAMQRGIDRGRVLSETGVGQGDRDRDRNSVLDRERETELESVKQSQDAVGGLTCAARSIQRH